MKIPQLFIFLISFILTGSLFAQPDHPLPSREKVKSMMDEEMKKSDLPAMVAVAINSKNQKMVYAYGPAIWSTGSKVSEKNIFRIYSMTKLVTSVAAMQLVEKGLITLDEDLSPRLPEMAKIPILSNGKFTEPKNPITLRHLLTHTSGFGSTATDQELAKFDKSKWEYKDLPRRFESGTQFLYGSSSEWAGKLIEKISGMSLEEYFRKNITGPLGMNRTWFNVPDSLKPYIVSTGKRGADGKQPLAEQANRIPKNVTTEFSGGGGLFSTPEDFSQLLQCMLNYGTLGQVTLLKRATVEEMMKNQIGDVSMKDAGAYFNPEFCCNFAGITSSTTKWGLAWMIDNEDKPYGRKAGTVAWGGLMNTYFYIDYKSGIAVSIYTQHLPFNHPQTTRLFTRFSEIIYSK